jgi:hypothetical protein
MRTIIAGSRRIFGRHHLDSAIQTCPWAHKITSVVCGGARGIDMLGDRWAYEAGFPVEYFIVTRCGEIAISDPFLNIRAVDGSPRNINIVSDWEWNGNAAGPIRNRAMAENADALIAVPLKGDRRGTDSMLALAREYGLLIHEWEVAG